MPSERVQKRIDIGDHPNIRPIFDLGQETDAATGVTQPFMVIPLMTGGDVEGVIEKAPDHRMPLERALQIERELGLVHVLCLGR